MSAYRWLPVLILFTLFLQACGELTELDEVGIVAGVGIDRTEEGEFEVTTHTISPKAVEQGEPKAFIVRTSTGSTIFEAVRDFIITHGKKQLWEHIEAFVISREIAEESVLPVMDFLYRDHEPRPKMYVFMSAEDAKPILERESEVDNVPARAMRKAIEEQEHLGKAPLVKIHDFMEDLLEPHRDPYLPIIRDSEHDFEIYGTAVFKDDRLAGELTGAETRAFLRAAGEMKGGLQVIEIPSDGGSGRPNNISFEIKSSTSTIKAEIKEGGHPELAIAIEETAVIGDINEYIPVNRRTIKEFEKEYEKTVKEEVDGTIAKIQKEFQSNILGFARVIRKKDKQYWALHEKEWDEIFPELEVEVTVSVDIENNQLIKDPIKSQ